MNWHCKIFMQAGDWNEDVPLQVCSEPEMVCMQLT